MAVEEVRSESRAPLRLGIVGLGAVAQAVHLPLLAKHPDGFKPSAYKATPSGKPRGGPAGTRSPAGRQGLVQGKARAVVLCNETGTEGAVSGACKAAERAGNRYRSPRR